MMMKLGKSLHLVLTAALGLFLVACGGGEAGDESGFAGPQSPNTPASPPPPSGNSNSPPQISGNPPSAVLVGTQFSFTPMASDPDGDNLTFSIENRPGWLTFDPTTGNLSGNADPGTEGEYANIIIAVSDGTDSAQLPNFSVLVAQVAQGQTTLNWSAPSTNTDGTPLTDLVGYNIYYGTSPGNLPNQIPVNNPGVTTLVVDNLLPDTYYFAATSVNANGVESDLSNVTTKVVN